MPSGVYERSEEQKNKLRGRVFSAEHRKNLSIAMLGRRGHPGSERQRLAAILSNKTRVVSAETRKKMSESRKKWKMTPEHIEKIRLTVIGREQSAETKKKLSEMRMGELNPAWRGGIKIDTPAMIIRSSKIYNRWRESCLKRDNWTCQVSKIRGGDMEIHHINNFSDNPDGRLDVENGITMKKDVHKLFHKIYSNRNNTQEQLDKFIKNYVFTDKTNISRGATGNIGQEITTEGGDTTIGSRIKSELPREQSGGL